MLKIGKLIVIIKVLTNYNAVICQKDAGGMANSVDPDQTAPGGTV